MASDGHRELLTGDKSTGFWKHLSGLEINDENAEFKIPHGISFADVALPEAKKFLQEYEFPELYYERSIEFMATFYGKFKGMFINGELAGIGSTYLLEGHSDIFKIDTLALKTEYRSHGYGMFLMRYLYKEGRIAHGTNNVFFTGSKLFDGIAPYCTKTTYVTEINWGKLGGNRLYPLKTLKFCATDSEFDGVITNTEADKGPHKEFTVHYEKLTAVRTTLTGDVRVTCAKVHSVTGNLLRATSAVATHTKCAFVYSLFPLGNKSLPGGQFHFYSYGGDVKPENVILRG